MNINYGLWIPITWMPPRNMIRQRQQHKSSKTRVCCTWLCTLCVSGAHRTVAGWNRMMTSSNGNIFRVISLLWENSPVTGEFPAQRPVTRSFDVFFDLRLNIRLSKQSSGWWFETPLHPLWRHCNGTSGFLLTLICRHAESKTTAPAFITPGRIVQEGHVLCHICSIICFKTLTMWWILSKWRIRFCRIISEHLR